MTAELRLADGTLLEIVAVNNPAPAVHLPVLDSPDRVFNYVGFTDERAVYVEMVHGPKTE